jgi:L-cysteine S-thiosulfotransferase
MSKTPWLSAAITVCAALAASSFSAQSQDFRSAQGQRSIRSLDKDNPLPELTSGYYFTPIETRAMQDDDFDNPGFRWVTEGEKLWQATEGAAGKNCGSCHGRNAAQIKAVATAYPKYYEPLKKLINLEQRINICRTQNMKAVPWQFESNELLAMTVYLRRLSRGKPMEASIDGPARLFYEIGKELYTRRAGQLDASCASCHNGSYGKKLRAETLSQGQSNGFPAYRTQWQTVGSLHRRFRDCNALVRAEPYPYGSDEYVAIELYLAWRGKGLPIEAPSVR